MSGSVGPIGKLARPLREAPVTIPALGAVAVFVAWAGSQAGYPVTHWAPGALIVLVLLAIAQFGSPLRLGEVPLIVRVALGCLALYTGLSFLSILWAGVPSDAWEGANRTLLYLLVFALFSLWPMRPASAALLICAWTLAMVGLGVFVLLHIDGVADPAGLFSEGRLKYPAGYENASAATWAMVSWPALLLACGARIPWVVRGLLAGGAVLLADLALMSQSRGSLYASVVMLVLVFVLLPRRVHLFAVLVPVAGGIALSAPLVLRVGDRLSHGGNVTAALHSATAAVLIAALLVSTVVAVGAALESRKVLSEPAAGRLRRGIGLLAIAVGLVLLVGGAVVSGDPVARVEHGWQTFKGGYGADAKGGSRLTSGLGSNRYDFYRVAIDEFVAHPLLGTGVDNFQQQYLLHGHSHETPRYPHSIELRALGETGVVGALLVLLALGAGVLAGARSALSPALSKLDPLRASVGAAALAGFAYWIVHGSVDWFWEFAGLGAPAFALLGLACGLVPPSEPEKAARSTSRARAAIAGRRMRRPLVLAGGLFASVAVAGSLAAPWLSQLQIESAAQIWRTAPRRAYAQLADASKLNPLAAEPFLVAGTIALRFNDLARADRDFASALSRSPNDAYATLERGAIASTLGHPRLGLQLLERAVRLNPRDPLALEGLHLAQQHKRVDVEALNRSILLNAHKFA